MGAVVFSLDSRLVECLQDVISLSVLVETGTFRGDTVSEFIDRFEEIHSVELSPDLCRAAQTRFANQPHVHVHEGDSATVLRNLRGRFEGQGVLYWLDAHWCVADGTAGQTSQCPLLQELAALKTIDDQSVILIDDARLYLCPPADPHEVSQWPSWQAIINGLTEVSDRHEMMVVNDVIAFYPVAARTALQRYARLHSVDWLATMHLSRLATELQKRSEQQQQAIEQLRDRVQRQAATLREVKAELQQARQHRS